MRVTVVCVTCGVEFTKTPSNAKKVKQHFCGHKCYGQWYSEHRRGASNPLYVARIEVQCAACHRPLMRLPREVRKHPKHFCDLVCQGAWMSEHLRGENNPIQKRSPRISAPCDNCGATLQLIPFQVKNWTTHFCNLHCHGEWMAKTQVGSSHPLYTTVETRCATCNKVVYRQPCHVKISSRQFCNATCHGVWLSKHLSGSRSHHWRGGPKGKTNYGPNWSAQRRAARQRDGNKCQYCGKTQFRIRYTLDVHHIIPFRLFGYKSGENENYLQANDLMNLISLCRMCHRRAEAGKIPLQPKLL